MRSGSGLRFFVVLVYVQFTLLKSLISSELHYKVQKGKQTSKPTHWDYYGKQNSGRSGGLLTQAVPGTLPAFPGVTRGLGVLLSQERKEERGCWRGLEEDSVMMISKINMRGSSY